MAELTVIEGTAKDNGDSVVTRWEKQRSVRVWFKDRRSLINLINDAIRQQDRSTLAQKAIEVVEATITNLRTLPANESTPEGRRDRAHLDVMAEGADEVADALRDLFRREGVDLKPD